MRYRLFVGFALVIAMGCGGAELKDDYQPRIVGEDPSGPGLSPTGDNPDGDDDDSTSKTLGSADSDAKTDPWFRMRKCKKRCVQAWDSRSKHSAHHAIATDCGHRCKRQWFTCAAAISHALVLMRKDKRRRNILIREGDRITRAGGLRECQRRRWALDTLGCMIKAESMRRFDDCEDDDVKRRRRLRRRRRARRRRTR